MSSSRSNSAIPSKRPENRATFQVIQWIFIVLSFCLILWLGKILIVDRETITANEYNPIGGEREADIIRGSILASNGSRLAYTDLSEDGSEVRRYPYGAACAHVVGYTGGGQAGLEDEVSEILLSPSTLMSQLQSWASDEKVQGCSVQTTLDIDLQKYIYDQLDGYRGAVIVSEPSTGRVLAMVSNPSFDPETLFDNWESIIANEESPLYARATMGLYPPGSVFKIITALAMYRNLPDYNGYSYECYGELQVDDQVIECNDHTEHGYMELPDAFAYSCNGFFGKAGIEMGARVLRQTAQYVKLGETFNFILPESESYMNLSESDVDSMVAQTAMGQGETLVTPMSINQLTCAIANQGSLYTPYLVEAVLDARGNVLEQTQPALWGSVMSESEAAFLQELMRGVTRYGTASRLSGYDYEVFGKTGTAQVNEDQDSHSWFTGFTRVDGKTDIAITVLLENGASGIGAVPLTDDILWYYYNRSVD